MNLTSRLAHLERQRPREAIGYLVRRDALDGTVLQELVMLASGRPGEPTRSFTPEGFAPTFPDGRIAGGVTLTDDGREPAPGSLMAAWRDAAIER